MNSAGMNYAQRLGACLKRRRGRGRTERVGLITGFPDEIDGIYFYPGTRLAGEITTQGSLLCTSIGGRNSGSLSSPWRLYRALIEDGN